MQGQALIDLSNIPTKPLGKREISQLEMALIVGTLYRPEVLELANDPIERSTWIDSLGVAAAAFARYKAGIPISQISEELGRSELTVKGHLNQKTRVGKLVAETYEKLKRGELKLAIPFVKAAETDTSGELSLLKLEVEKLKEQNRALEEEIKGLYQCREELEALRGSMAEREATIQKLKEEVESISRDRAEISAKYNKLLEDIAKIRELILEALSLISK
ncbi:MAG: transcriptional regulator [Desulfurococcaceae archaeon]